MSSSTSRILEISKEEFVGIVPQEAKAAIVARYDVARHDAQTDYYHIGSVFDVVLGFSRHQRDMFTELRKMAARFGPTEHLGPGKNLYRIRAVLTTNVNCGGYMEWAGQFSPIHRHFEPGGDGNSNPFFSVKEAEAFIASSPELPAYDYQGQRVTAELRVFEESIEHREKFAGGRGYYLKADSTYLTGWSVCKYPFPLTGLSRFIVIDTLVPLGMGRIVSGPWEAIPDEPAGKLAKAIEEVIGE